MKYDPIELMKLNITEADIQKQRDSVLKALTMDHEFAVNKVVMMYDRFWLPFIIDMLEGYKITITPSMGHYVSIEINLNP